jgi:phosphate-selective porin OprO/OprP
MGPVKLQTEWVRASYEQKTLATPLEQDIDAYYVNASWMITGETYASSYKNGLMDRMTPKNNYTGFGSSGWGAWEVSARYSDMDASDFTLAGMNGVSGKTYTNKAHSYTVGLKWIVDPNTRFLLNYINTDFDTAINGGYSTVPSFNSEKAINFRAQFDF